MMTEEEREIFFQRDESFTERFSEFWQSAPLVKKVREFDALGKYSSFHNRNGFWISILNDFFSEIKEKIKIDMKN